MCVFGVRLRWVLLLSLIWLFGFGFGFFGNEKWGSFVTCSVPFVHADVDVGTSTVCDSSAIFFFASIMDDRDQQLMIIIIRGGRSRVSFNRNGFSMMI